METMKRALDATAEVVHDHLGTAPTKEERVGASETTTRTRDNDHAIWGNEAKRSGRKKGQCQEA